MTTRRQLDCHKTEMRPGRKLGLFSCAVKSHGTYADKAGRVFRMENSEPNQAGGDQDLGTVLTKYLTCLLATEDLQDRARTYAYRGQRDASWSLRSAAARRLERSEQQSGQDLPQPIELYVQRVLLKPFRELGYDLVDGHRQSDLECLGTLQHQRAATPLLDFSYSPLVALWFASESTQPDTDGRVFKADITASQTITKGHARVDDSTFGTILDGLRYPREILAWQPPHTGDSGQRILAQQSVLLLCKHDAADLNTVGNRHFEDFTVDVSEKKLLRDDLRAAGLDERTLFPDIDGFARANRFNLPAGLPDPHELLSRANASYNSGDFDLAAEFYYDYLDIYPDNKEVKLLVSNAMVDAQEFKAAQRVLSDIDTWAQTELPDAAKSNYLFNKANVEAALGVHESGVRDYTQSLELESRPGTHFNRGNSYAQLRRYDEAIIDYKQCEEFAAALFNIGNAYAAKFDFETAENYFARAAQKQPGTEHFQTNLSTMRQVRALIGEGDDDPQSYRTTDSDSLGIMIWMKNVEQIPPPRTRVFPLVGNVGNVGNTGYLNTSGGKGFRGATGKPLYVVYPDKDGGEDNGGDR